MADDSERALQQLTKAIAVAYELTLKLRKQAADSAQHVVLLEQSLWQATGALKRARNGSGDEPTLTESELFQSHRR